MGVSSYALTRMGADGLQAEEGGGGVLSSDIRVKEDARSSWMEVGELGEVIHERVDDDPQVALLVVLGWSVQCTRRQQAGWPAEKGRRRRQVGWRLRDRDVPC